jgi:6,7-dimethyl-8-ribityllumazine synthase
MITIVASTFDKSGDNVIDALIDSTTKELKKHKEKYEVVKVPGAVEIPVTVQKYIRDTYPKAVIALGCVIKGDTDHYEYVLRSCIDGLTHVSLSEAIPVVQGILACKTPQQAIDRKHMGKEYAQTAIAMKKIFSN